MMDDLSPPPIGDNSGVLPYDPAIFDQHNAKTRQWLDVAGEWLKAGEITTEEQANKLKEWLDGAKPLQDEVEAARRAELVPHEGKIAGVNKAYLPLVDGWKNAIKGLKPILGAFVLRERERKEKERQAREAAAAKQLEDAKREAARAEESGDFIGQAEAAKTLKAAEKTAKAAARPVKAVVGSGVGNGRAVAVTKVKTVIIDDIDLAFLEVRNDPRVVDAIQSALNAIVRSKEWGEGRRLRGAHVEEKEAVR